MSVVDALLGEKNAQPQTQASDPAIASVLAELKELKVERQKMQHAQFKEGELAKIRAILEKDPSKYAIARKLNANDNYTLNDVWGAAAQHYQSYGEKPDYAELIEKAEKVYEENLLGQINEMLGDQAIYDRYVARFGHPGKEKVGQPPAKTLQNRSSEPMKKDHPMSEDERLELAKMYFGKALRGENP
jgi:hypothetical protein